MKLILAWVCLAGFFVIYWLWPGQPEQNLILVNESAQRKQSTNDDLVSAIQPIGKANVETNNILALPGLATQVVEYTPSPIDQEEFEAANKALSNGNFTGAIQRFSNIIERQPGLLEPYINLASSQAALGNLEAARATLMQGLKALDGSREVTITKCFICCFEFFLVYWAWRVLDYLSC